MTNMSRHTSLHKLYENIPGHEERDYWNGIKENICYQKSLSYLDENSYIIIEKKQWIEQETIGYIISSQEALQEIIHSDNLQLLDEVPFQALKVIYEKTINNTNP